MLRNMLKILAISFLLLATIDPSFQISKSSSAEYVAGVVEYAPNMNIDPVARMKHNLEKYLQFIADAQRQDVEILVFPESTLNIAIGDRTAVAKSTTEVPEPSEHVVPCKTGRDKYTGTYEDILVPLSCAAKENKMYVVVNLSEQELCDAESQAQKNDTRPCAYDGKSFYNTDVVFDRSGAVIARYRKYNLFGERNYNTTHIVEHATFETDFGVRFGLFTCFDIMFKEPALSMVRSGVKDFIFPTMWFSEMPFLTALQIQEYWSYTNDVNLLASGASNTLMGSGGSGIYAGVRGPLVHYISIPGRDNNKLLVAKVPKLMGDVEEVPAEITMPRTLIHREEKDANMDAFRMKRDQIDHFTSELIGETYTRRLCSGDVCCNFNVTSRLLKKTEEKEFYQYRAMVGDIVRSFSGAAKGGIKSCAIVACSGSDLKLCAQRFSLSRNVVPHQVFHSIHIEGYFPATEDVLTMPNTLSHSMRPLPAGSFTYSEYKRKDEDKKHVTMRSRGLPIDNLQTFGIYGRDFREDGDSQEEMDYAYFQYKVVHSS